MQLHHIPTVQYVHNYHPNMYVFASLKYTNKCDSYLELAFNSGMSLCVVYVIVPTLSTSVGSYNTINGVLTGRWNRINN